MNSLKHSVDSNLSRNLSPMWYRLIVIKAASPACTELETIVLDWLGKMIGLPEEFLAFSENSKGGGVIQVSTKKRYQKNAGPIRRHIFSHQNLTDICQWVHLGLSSSSSHSNDPSSEGATSFRWRRCPFIQTHGLLDLHTSRFIHKRRLILRSKRLRWSGSSSFAFWIPTISAVFVETSCRTPWRFWTFDQFRSVVNCNYPMVSIWLYSFT